MVDRNIIIEWLEVRIPYQHSVPKSLELSNSPHVYILIDNRNGILFTELTLSAQNLNQK